MRARVLCEVLLLLALLVLLPVTSIASVRSPGGAGTELIRDDFPLDFIFGSGTSAYQVEGAAAEDGRTPSVWDTGAHAGKVANGSTADITCDGYHKYKDDIKLMKELGLKGYRFSISWSRLIPKGRGDVNPKGLQFYNDFINELIGNGIQPHVTLFHYDLPQALEDEYQGWLSPKIVDDFTAYADVCFKEFGDRVSYWTTLNEPNFLALAGYDTGIFPPFRCSSRFGRNCSIGDSTLEPYIVGYHCILAHAEVATLYRRKYQVIQKGFIGLNVFVYHFTSLTNSTRDVAAAQRAYDFYTGWFVNPLVNGDYPSTMKERTGNKMPSFSVYQSEYIKGSFDFLGVNHYATVWVSDVSSDNSSTYERDFGFDMSVKLTVFGMQGMLEHFKNVYGNPPIYIHENGYSTPQNSSLEDTPRVEYLKMNIGSLLDAVRNGSNARGYFTWSFLDVFELNDGYQSSFGLYHVDFEDKELTRRPKLSARWYSHFLKGGHNNIVSVSVSNNSNPSEALA
ncbi:unnamed protein product [Spirodela intermedia]|uniref:Uncharacterized protein n=1 Tax=Spirodela intermedia TaxID=51605 RepID=A0A7I8KKW9_SPIIN|nr:unnamed protein product [Spirodela intermedia]